VSGCRAFGDVRSTFRIVYRIFLLLRYRHARDSLCGRLSSSHWVSADGFILQASRLRVRLAWDRYPPQRR
jgi:hypothetical protein